MFELYCRFSRWLGVLLVVAAGLFSLPALADRELMLDALRDGGYVVYFRHAPTDWLDTDILDSEAAIRSCDRNQMRQLSDVGRATAKAVGDAMRRLEIPVNDVYASEYCRTTETAQLLGFGPVQPTRDVLNTLAADYVGGREALAEKARARLSTPPPKGTNTVVVGHGNVFLLVAGVRPPEAGAAVVQPLGNGDFSVLGLLSADDWMELAAQSDP